LIERRRERRRADDPYRDRLAGGVSRQHVVFDRRQESIHATLRRQCRRDEPIGAAREHLGGSIQ